MSVDLFCKKTTFQDMKKILIIVPDGGMLFESAGIADILMQANRLHPEGAGKLCYQVQLATTQPHQVIHGQSGLNLLADHRLHEIDPREPLDTIIITGRGQNPQEGIAVVDWLRLAAPHARRIASICGGAMLLAQTGLLDGRRATTHWKLLETMQAEFPQVRVESGPLYIQDEHIWTSGGVSSGFDLTLALVEEDYGFSLARDVAQDFVMYLRRPGGQLQFSRYNLQQTSPRGPINDLLAWLLEAKRGEMVTDFCAGAGGKTLAIGATMRSTGRLYAFDVSAHRLDALKPRLARSGLSNVHPAAIAHERDERIKRLAGKMDRVLVDAPCSGLGTLRRNPDLKWRQSAKSVQELVAKQTSILDSAARLLKPGGRLVYATCSILPQENEAIAEAFSAAHPDFEMLDAGELLEQLKVADARSLCSGGASGTGYLRLWPHLHHTDGFFAAVWAKKA